MYCRNSFWNFSGNVRLIFLFQGQGHKIVQVQKPRWNICCDISWHQIIIFAPKSKQSNKPQRIRENVCRRNGTLFLPLNHFYFPVRTWISKVWCNTTILFCFMLWCSQVKSRVKISCSAHMRYVCVSAQYWKKKIRG